MKPTNRWLGPILWAGPLSLALSFQLHAVEPVLDAYAYVMNSNVDIDIENQIVSFESNMTNCLQDDGQDPVETLGWTLFTNNQSFGLSQFRYAPEQDRLYLISETINLICDNAVYVDTIFQGGYE